MSRIGFNKHDIARDACQLFGPQAHQGYDWWWHSFTGYDAQTGEAKPFFIEFFLCNPALGTDKPVFGQVPGKHAKPSYLMVKAGAWGPDAAKRHNRLWNGGNGVGTIQLFDRHGNLVDRIHAENIGCEYGEYLIAQGDHSDPSGDLRRQV